METALVQRLLEFFDEVQWNSTPHVVMFALTTHIAFKQAHNDQHASTTAAVGVIFHIAFAGYCLWSQASVPFALNFFLWRVAVFYATLALSITVYRLFFHRLRRFPGPFGARVTKFYNSWHYIGGRNYQNLDKLHEKYGRVVRTGGFFFLIELALLDEGRVQRVLTWLYHSTPGTQLHFAGCTYDHIRTTHSMPPGAFLRFEQCQG